MEKSRIEIAAILIASTILGIFYAYYMLLSGSKGVYGVYDVFGPLSRCPIASPLLISSEALLLIASMLSLKHGKSGKMGAFVIVYSIALISFLRYFWPDVSNSYYMTDFEDSFNHAMQATYITTKGHIEPHTFSSLQPGYWLTLATTILGVFGKTNSINSPPFYFIIKWWTPIFILMSLPVVFTMLRLLGLSKGEAGLVMISYLMLSPEFSCVVSNDYALIPFALSLAFYVKALKSNEKRDYIMLFIVFLFAIFNHQLIALWLEFGVLGTSITLLFFKKYRKRSFYLISTFLTAYLMRIIYTSRSLLQQNLLSVINNIFSGAKMMPHLYRETLRAFPAYSFAVGIKADDYILLLAIPFLILLLFSFAYKKIEHVVLLLFLLFSGLVAAFQVVGMGGIGWADRLPKDLLPLLSFGFSLPLLYKSNKGDERKARRRKTTKERLKNKGIKTAGFLLIALVSILSLYATWAGYSTVAFPYSEPFGEAGIGIGVTSRLSPNFDFKGQAAFIGQYLNVNSSPGYYEFAWSYFIYDVYSSHPNQTRILASISYVSNTSNIVLMTPTLYIMDKLR
ncbi:MAG: hypothetical protein G5Z43_001127 [Caldisphaeraceae archaeon]|nr:hypothetical protein [Caldisphaeraceae archaeon]